MSQPPAENAEVRKVLDAALSTIKAEQYGFFITLDESGQPQARLVAAAGVEPDLRVWILTSPETWKVAEINRDKRATMAFSDNKGEGYATLIGHARLIDDRVRKNSLWKLEYGAFFPGGPEGSDSVLIEFAPHRIEVMHFHLKIGIWPWNFKPAILFREGGAWILRG